MWNISIYSQVDPWLSPVSTCYTVQCYHCYLWQYWLVALWLCYCVTVTLPASQPHLSEPARWQGGQLPGWPWTGRSSWQGAERGLTVLGARGHVCRWWDTCSEVGLCQAGTSVAGPGWHSVGEESGGGWQWLPCQPEAGVHHPAMVYVHHWLQY